MLSLLFAVLTGSFAIALTAWTEYRIHYNTPATATITDLIENKDHYLCPTFQFTASNGKIITVHSTNGIAPNPYTKGQSIPILYEPTNPQSATIATFIELWFPVIILTIITLVEIAIATLLTVVTRHLDQKPITAQHTQAPQPLRPPSTGIS